MRPYPVPSPADGESDLFRNRLDSLIDMRHEFVRLSRLIDWKRFDGTFGELYAEKGRPGLPTRLMVGLHLIKHARGLSDEQVCAQWLRTPTSNISAARLIFRPRCRSTGPRCRRGAAASAPRSWRR
jgi:transposase, IS5 family